MWKKLTNQFWRSKSSSFLMKFRKSEVTVNVKKKHAVNLVKPVFLLNLDWNITFYQNLFSLTLKLELKKETKSNFMKPVFFCVFLFFSPVFGVKISRVLKLTFVEFEDYCKAKVSLGYNLSLNNNILIWNALLSFKRVLGFYLPPFF